MLEEESIYYGEKEGRASHGNRYMGLGLLTPLLDQEAEEGKSGFIVLFLYEPSDCDNNHSGLRMFFSTQ